MKPKFTQLLETCIIDGVTWGHTKAYKHNDSPSKADINEAIVNAVLLELYEWFDFDEATGEKQCTQLEQAAKLALEALECLVDTEQSFGALDYGDNAISALRNALAQPTQDTAVGSFLFGGGRWNQVDAEYENDHDVVKLYRLPQQPMQPSPKQKEKSNDHTTD